jgi:hypothetical protein
MKQALRRKLKSLWIGELAAVVVFIFAYWRLRTLWGTQVLGDYSLLALVILCIILLQGSAYWWLKLRRLDTPSLSLAPAIIQSVYAVDLLLLLTYPAAILIAMINGTIESALPDAVIGGAIYLFALAEFVHYFVVKLVRSDADRSALSRRRQVNARLMRELQRSETRKEST